MSAEFKITETFLTISVADMDRATAFYVQALGATTTWASPRWTSLSIAGVRIGLFAHQDHAAGRIGLNFAVTHLHAAVEAVVRAGGRLVASPSEVAPGVLVVDVADTENNLFSLQESNS